MPQTDRLLIEPLGHEHVQGMVVALDHKSVGEYLGVGFAQVATATRQLASFDEGDLVFVAR